jgi:queuine tRNA-ribosyltransferase
VPTRRRRHRRNDDALARFAIHESADGYATIAHVASGELMHGRLDPADEAEGLYVDQSRLRERLRESSPVPLVIWDVGLGAAHNAMAVLRAAEATAAEYTGRPLHLVSFEHDVASLRLALRNAPRFPHLNYRAPGDVLRWGEWRSERAALAWTLVEGDFRSTLGSAPTPDLIFYDPFSAKTDVAMWTLECFESVFAECAEHDTELFTYSASTVVRTAMLAAGFVVARGAATGRRPETTVAMTPAAAMHAAARGRVVLGPEWLDRWQRSDAKYPPDVPSVAHAALGERIASLSQFRTSAP